MSILFLIIPILVFLTLEALFSGSETAIISANKMRFRAMAERGNKRAVHVNQLLKSPGRLLGTTLVGTNISVAVGTTLASIIVATLLKNQFGIDRTDIESFITTIIMIPFILIFGEIIPKSIGRNKANSVALAISPFLKWTSVILYPVAAPVAKLSSYLALLFGRKNSFRKLNVADELRLLARISEKEGLLRPHQRKMIDRVFNLERQTVGHVMVPLVDVVSIEKNSPLEEFYDKIATSGFSRFPVYEDRVDNIIGIINVLDVLYSNGNLENISSFIYEDILYFPESKHITTSLRELQNSKYPMAIVVDEYGGVVGIVTTKDLAEEIVGEIKQEWEKEEEEFDESKLECDGRTEIDIVNERLGTDIPKEGYETIAGFLIKQMDKIPEVGDEVRWKDLLIRILRADKRSILRVKFIFIEGNTNDDKAETGNTER
jgi:putative hemolysin